MKSKMIELDGCCDFFGDDGSQMNAASFFGMDFGPRGVVARPDNRMDILSKCRFPTKGVNRPAREQFMGIDIYKKDEYTGVFALSICAVHDKLIPKYGKYDYRTQNRDRLDQRMKIKLEAFAKRFNLTFYDEFRENFDVWEAIDKAIAGGFAGVIVEDLS